MENWRRWLAGGISVFIGGAANMVTVIVIDPINFNLGAQWRKTLAASFVGGILALANYLKTPPATVSIIQETSSTRTTKTDLPDDNAK